ncbi:MAG: helicase HerA domain-containing protein [Candidatus Micrarchaeia archaeon]
MIEEIVAIPDGLKGEQFLEASLGREFALVHDLSHMRTLIFSREGFGGRYGVKARPSSIELNGSFILASALQTKGIGIYNLFGFSNNQLIVMFYRLDSKDAEKARKRVEDELSSFQTKVVRRVNEINLNSELYYDSYRRQLLASWLESLNEAEASNTCYNVVLAFPENDRDMLDYLKSRSVLSNFSKISAKSIEELFDKARRKDVPIGPSAAAKFISLSPAIQRIISLGNMAVQNGDICIGSGLVYGEKQIDVCMDSSSLKFGTIISGLPGTGKTFAAMSIAEQAHKEGIPVVAIAPTEEWNAFGNANNLPVISFYQSAIPINFFKCDAKINIERFYENLASLLALASNAGPYTRTLEKVLLAAFRKVYAETVRPDPQDVYDAIEDEIIEEHAKRSNVGIEFTKHGENTMAALQNLRLMLMRREFAYSEGIDFAKLLERGAIFDLSSVSNSMKPFYYSLILNQLYSVIDSLPEDTSNGLRLLALLEEAQLPLQGNTSQAVVEDLKQRIQDFRKKKVGLVLITHNVTDINKSIRRLCQNKLYFRQSPDVARFAASDLVFGDIEQSKVHTLLKTLGDRICAFVSVDRNNLSVRNAILVITRELSMPDVQRTETYLPGLSKMRVLLKNDSGVPVEARVKIEYVGTKVFSGKTDKSGIVELDSLPGKRYKVYVLGEKKKDTKVFVARGGEENEFVL